MKDQLRDKRLQTTLKELQNIKFALDQASIVAVTDKDGVIQSVNDKFIEISQYSRKELIGKTHRLINSHFHSREFFNDMWETIKSGKVWRGEIRNQKKDGSFYWVSTVIAPVLDKYGKPEQFIAVRHDITKRKELEQIKDEFLSVASHELKTPITSIKAYTQLLKKQAEGLADNRFCVNLQKMDKQIDRMTKLILDLLDVSKIQAGKLEYKLISFDLNQLLVEIIGDFPLIDGKHKIVLKGRSKRQVIADPYRVAQVVVNLLSNACKYSAADCKIIVRVTPNDELVTVSVKDYGIGIPKDSLESIFYRFCQVNGQKRNSYPGMRLGLYISSEIIKRFGGRLWAKSQEGQGAVFHFTLPYQLN